MITNSPGLFPGEFFFCSEDGKIKVGKTKLWFGASCTQLPQDVEQLPSGLIAMWSGSVTNVPLAWHICDGSNGTPDLRDRFIVGAGSSYNVGSSGGEKAVTLTTNQIPSHTHSGTANINAGHQFLSTTSRSYYAFMAHPSDIGSWDVDDYGTGAMLLRYKDDYVSGDLSLNVSGNITTGASGGSQEHENRPPYYALAFIMKL